MHARDLLKDFLVDTFAASAEQGLNEGIFSDIYGTLMRRAEGAKNFTLDQPYHDFLVWTRAQGIPVKLVSSDTRRARQDLTEAGCAPELLATLSDKLSVYGQSNMPFEVIIDDDVIFEPSVIFISPMVPKFRDFVATSQYKNLGISHPANLPHPPAL